MVENAIFGAPAFPHEHEKVAIRVDGGDRGMPEISGVVHALAPMAHESLGTREIRKTGRILRSDDNEEELRRQGHESLRRQGMPLEGSKLQRQRFTACPVDRQHGRAIIRGGVKAGRSIRPQSSPIVDELLRAGSKNSTSPKGLKADGVRRLDADRLHGRNSLVGQNGLEEASEAGILRCVEDLGGRGPPRQCARRP